MFTLKKIKIKGFRAYVQERELTFDAPAVLLFGNNHCGKSSTMNAIEWCLFGNECLGTKSGIRERVDWEIPNRNLGLRPEVVIELESEDQNHGRYRVLRRYRSKTKDELNITLPDGRILEEEEAQKKIFQLLRSTYHDFSTTAYQHQEAIRAVLIQEPRERNDAIDRLLGLSAYRNILSGVDGARLSDKQKEMGRDFDHFTNEIEVALRTRESDLKGKREEAIHKGVKGDRINEKGGLNVAKEVKDQLEKFTSETGLRLTDFPIPEKWKELQRFQELAKEEIKKLRSELPDAKRQNKLFLQRTELIHLKTDYEKAKEAYQKAREMLEIFVRGNGGDELLKKNRAEIETQIIEKEKEMSKVNAKASTISKAMEYLGLGEVDKNRCPVCGKEAPDLLAHLKQEWEKKYEEDVGTIQDQINGLRKKLKDIDVLLAQYKRLKESVETGWEAIKGVHIKIGEALRREITEKDDPIVLLNNELNKIQTELDKLKEAIEAKQNILSGITIRLEEVQLITDILNSEEKKKIVEEIRQTQEYKQIEELKDQMAILIHDLAQIRQAASEASHEDAQRKILVAGGVIDGYFRRITNNPSVKKINFMVSMDPKTAKNNYEFKDQDGKDLTPILSQGDLNGLALSIFLGMASLKGAEEQCGFIMLDDPSQSLGSNHKEKLVEVLDEVLNEKVIILSTMDKELQELILLKITKSKTKYIFVDWTPETGPEIKKE